MSKKYKKLTRDNQRRLETGQCICEHNIKFTRLGNGDGLYEIYFTANGRRYHRIVGRESEGLTLTKVEAILQKAKSDAIAERFGLPDGRKHHMTFKEAASKYIELLQLEDGKNVKPKERQLENYLTPFFNSKPLSQISTFDVECFKKYLKVEKGRTEATVNRHLAVLSHLFNKAVEWGWIRHKPCIIRKYREGNHRITYLTQEQCSRLLEEAARSEHPYLHAFIMIGLNTGMRHSEIFSIRLENIDLDRRVIYIPKAKAGAREQPITKALAEYLSRFLQSVPQDQPWLFPSSVSRSGHQERIDKAFKRAVEDAGLDPKQVVRHTLRHTAITHLVQAGVDLPTVKRISGHKTLQMVERYSHQNGEHIQAAMDKLEGRYFA